MVQGAQLWVKAINQKGGINGHEVQLIVYDDGGDPARHRAQVQEAIERRHVIAFLQNAELFTGAGSVEYITAKGVPIVGISGGEDWAGVEPDVLPPRSLRRRPAPNRPGQHGAAACPVGTDEAGDPGLCRGAGL